MTEKARILFVDDEKRVLNSMRGLFRRDYELFLTCEGAEAIRIAAENDIDVIDEHGFSFVATGLIATRFDKFNSLLMMIEE